jgi:hypothetical protein
MSLLQQSAQGQTCVNTVESATYGRRAELTSDGIVWSMIYYMYARHLSASYVAFVMYDQRGNVYCGM